MANTFDGCSFGFGKHACPGRFYAVRKTKLIFTKLITEYEIQWNESQIPTTMPGRLSLNGQFAPNQSQKVSLRPRLRV